MIAKIDCMINKKIAEVIPGNFIMNLSPASQQQENNKSVYVNKDISSSLFTKQIEKNCKHRTEAGFCNLGKKPCLHFIKSTLNIAI